MKRVKRSDLRPLVYQGAMLCGSRLTCTSDNTSQPSANLLDFELLEDYTEVTGLLVFTRVGAERVELQLDCLRIQLSTPLVLEAGLLEALEGLTLPVRVGLLKVDDPARPLRWRVKSEGGTFATA